MPSGESGPLEEITRWEVADEAINAVAFAGDWLAASTRTEIAIAPRGCFFGEGTAKVRRFPGGAHGVVSTSSGRFLAPLGPDGLLEIELGGPEPKFHDGKFDGLPRNLYKIVRLGTGEAGEVFGCVARRDGLLVMTHSPSGIAGPVLALPSNDLDLIDICPLGPMGDALAWAALASDRTLLLGTDLPGMIRQSVRFDGMVGRAYTLLAAEDHLFLLTSRALYVLPHVISPFLAGESLGRVTRFFEVPIRSSDAYLLEDRIAVDFEGRIISWSIRDLIRFGMRESSSTNLPLRWPDGEVESWAVHPMTVEPASNGLLSGGVESQFCRERLSLII